MWLWPVDGSRRRGCCSFQAPPQLELEWDDKNLLGQSRWLRRLDGLVAALEVPWIGAAPSTQATAKLRSQVHKTVAEITVIMEETFSFNGTVVHAMVRVLLYRFDDWTPQWPLLN
jgi:leucyl-tRNA synthetase